MRSAPIVLNENEKVLSGISAASCLESIRHRRTNPEAFVDCGRVRVRIAAHLRHAYTDAHVALRGVARRHCVDHRHVLPFGAKLCPRVARDEEIAIAVSLPLRGAGGVEAADDLPPDG